MSLELTSRTENSGGQTYNQVIGSVKTGSDKTTATKTSQDESRNERNLESTGNSIGKKKSSSLRESNSDRQVDSKNLTSRTSTERANIAFSISFSIPLTGVIPTSNC